MKTSKSLIAIALFAAAAILAGCGSDAPSSAPSPESVQPQADGGAVSAPASRGNLFDYADEKTAEWAASVSDDNAPVSVSVSWANIGGVVYNIYDDKDTVISAFNSIAALSVKEETKSIATDNEIGVSFFMKDGSEHSVTFNDGNALFYKDGEFKCYTVNLNNNLNSLFNKTMKYNSSETYKISVESGEKFMAGGCPKKAKGGEEITLHLLSVTDGELHVYLNNSMLSEYHFENEDTVHFIMPFNDVNISVKFSDEGYGGA